MQNEEQALVAEASAVAAARTSQARGAEKESKSMLQNQ